MKGLGSLGSWRGWGVPESMLLGERRQLGMKGKVNGGCMIDQPFDCCTRSSDHTAAPNSKLGFRRRGVDAVPLPCAARKPYILQPPLATRSNTPYVAYRQNISCPFLLSVAEALRISCRRLPCTPSEACKGGSRESLDFIGRSTNRLRR